MSAINDIYLKAVEYQAGEIRQGIDAALVRCQQEVSRAIGHTDLEVEVSRFEDAIQAAAAALVQRRITKLLYGF